MRATTTGPARLSVAIATYNRAAMVVEAIEAVLSQSRLPVEIVVADDASTDATAATLAELAVHEPRLRVIRREENSGGVENWNLAMRQTRGDFIAWCSDDDRFLPKHLERSVDYLESHPEVGLVHSNFIDAVETGGVSEQLPRKSRSEHPMILDSRGMIGYLTRYFDWPFHPSTIVMRREVWEQVGEFDDGYALADTDWFVRAVELFPAAMLPDYGCINRRHPGNWSNRVGSARMQREIFEIVESAIDRRWAGRHPGKILWRTIWRANVRLRLGLTLRARMRSGHGDAAVAAWSGLVRHTGRRAPEWIERAGAAVIVRFTSHGAPHFEDARQSVSPL